MLFESRANDQKRSSEKRSEKRRAENDENLAKKPRLDEIWVNAKVAWPMTFFITKNEERVKIDVTSAQERSRALILMVIVEYVSANILECVSFENLNLIYAAEQEYQEYKKSGKSMEQYIQ